MTQSDAIDFAIGQIQLCKECGVEDDYIQIANPAIYALYKLQNRILKANQQARERRLVKRMVKIARASNDQ